MTSLSSRIIYEDNHLIAINKEVGELSQGDKTGDITLIDDVKAYLKEKYSKPGNVYLGLPHRLDRPTSGAILFAKTEKALSRLSDAFRKGEVDKTYYAIVTSRPRESEERLIHYIVRNERTNTSVAYDREVRNSQKAVLSYYGAERSNRDGGICLHSRSIELIHPVRKERMKIIAPLPDSDIWPLFKGLDKDLDNAQSHS